MAWFEWANNADVQNIETCSTVSDLRDSIDSSLSDTMLSPDEATQIQESAYNASIECSHEARNKATELSGEILTQWINITAGSAAEGRMLSFFKVDFPSVRENLASQWITVPDNYIARHNGSDTVYIHQANGTAIAEVNIHTWEVGEVGWWDWWQKDDTSDNMDAQMLIEQHDYNVDETEWAYAEQIVQELSRIWDGQDIHIMDRDMNNPDILRTLAHSFWIAWDGEVWVQSTEQMRKMYEQMVRIWAQNRILSDYSDDVISVSKNWDQFTMRYNGNLIPDQNDISEHNHTRGQVELTFNQWWNLLREQVMKY